MAASYTDNEVQDVLLRAQRAMLAISDRIDSDLLYLYTGKYLLLKSQQYDIYTLFKAIGNEVPYTPYDDYFYPLVSALIDKCQEVDSYDVYSEINPNYVNISGATQTIIIDGGNTYELSFTNADLVAYDVNGDTLYYLPIIEEDGNVPALTSAFVLLNRDELVGKQLITTVSPNRIYGFSNNEAATIKVTYTK